MQIQEGKMCSASGYECQGVVTLNDIVEEKRLWTSKHEKMGTQGAWMGMYDGFERQNEWWL